MIRDGSILLERRRISRDLHDGSIQPYIGLKWALEAIQAKAASGHPVTEDLMRLVARVDHEILFLRTYVDSLRKFPEPQEIELPAAFRTALNRWGELYNLSIRSRSTGPVPMVNEPLASSVLSIAHEGLSNIRRHTVASSARIWLFCGADQVRLSIVNPVAPGASLSPFTPQSVDERARALGGYCRVDFIKGRDARVVVQLPRTSP